MVVEETRARSDAADDRVPSSKTPRGIGVNFTAIGWMGYRLTLSPRLSCVFSVLSWRTHSCHCTVH